MQGICMILVECQRLPAASLGFRDPTGLEQAKPGLEERGGRARRSGCLAGLRGGGAPLATVHRCTLAKGMHASLDDSRICGKVAAMIRTRRAALAHRVKRFPEK